MNWSTLSHGPHRVSVIVPVRNEARSICSLLDALRAQTRAPDEVVICDGGSTDGTAHLVENYARRWAAMRVLRAGPAFPGRARNLGIQVARGDLIALTDAGTWPHQRWLERLTAPFEGPSPPDVVYGRFEPVTESFRQRCIALAFVPPRDPRSGLRTPFVASMAMRSGVWATAGGFREDLRSAEDLLFIQRISDARLSIAYAPDAVVFWNPPGDFSATFRRFTAYSYSNIRAGLAGEWQVPPLRIYLFVVVLALTVFWTPLGGLAPLVVLGGRAVKRVVREMGVRGLARIATIGGTALALGIIDLATFCGCWRWLTADGFLKAGLRLRPWAWRNSREG